MFQSVLLTAERRAFEHRRVIVVNCLDTDGSTYRSTDPPHSSQQRLKIQFAEEKQYAPFEPRMETHRCLIVPSSSIIHNTSISFPLCLLHLPSSSDNPVIHRASRVSILASSPSFLRIAHVSSFTQRQATHLCYKLHTRYFSHTPASTASHDTLSDRVPCSVYSSQYAYALLE